MAEKTFELSSPIPVHGKAGAEQVKQITLRDPNLDDLFDLGLPFTDAGGLDFPALKKWLNRLAPVGYAGGIGAMAPTDIYPINDWLVERLLPVPQKN